MVLMMQNKLLKHRQMLTQPQPQLKALGMVRAIHQPMQHLPQHLTQVVFINTALVA
jgi:hypothetical protein